MHARFRSSCFQTLSGLVVCWFLVFCHLRPFLAPYFGTSSAGFAFPARSGLCPPCRLHCLTFWARPDVLLELLLSVSAVVCNVFQALIGCLLGTLVVLGTAFLLASSRFPYVYGCVIGLPLLFICFSGFVTSACRASPPLSSVAGGVLSTHRGLCSLFGGGGGSLFWHCTLVAALSKLSCY